jgi:predicted RecA/RadA family phage recombinase
VANNVIFESPETLTYTAPLGGVQSGVPVLVGDRVVIPLEDVDAGEQFAAYPHCRAIVPKVSAQAWVEGVAVYFDAEAGLFTTTNDSDVGPAGIAAAAAANPSSTGIVDIGEGPAGSGGGSGTIIYATPAALRAIATIGEGIPAGTPVSVAITQMHLPTGELVELPNLIQWCPTFLVYAAAPPSQTAYEPDIIIPDDVWALAPAERVGAWVDSHALATTPSYVVDLAWPMPLTTEPGAPGEGDSFLTTGDHASPYQIGTYSGGSWSYSEPGDEFVARFRLGERVYYWEYRSAPQGWAFLFRDATVTEGMPFFPEISGIGNSPAEVIDAELPVYAIGPDPTGDWAGHADEWTWLDGNGTTWLFGGDCMVSAPWSVSGSIVLIRETDHRVYMSPFIPGVGWERMIDGCEVAVTEPASGPSPLTLSVYARPNRGNWGELNGTYGGEAVVEYVRLSGVTHLVTVTTGTPLGGNRALTTVRQVEFQFADDGPAGEETGVVLIDGRAWPVTITTE